MLKVCDELDKARELHEYFKAKLTAHIKNVVLVVLENKEELPFAFAFDKVMDANTEGLSMVSILPASGTIPAQASVTVEVVFAQAPGGTKGWVPPWSLHARRQPVNPVDWIGGRSELPIANPTRVNADVVPDS